MGSRGDFANVDANNFTFKEGRRKYESIGIVSGVKVLVQTAGSVKAPEFSHSPNRIYAVIQNGKIKHLAYYDSNHRQAACIDFNHSHNGKSPHKHLYLNHRGEAADLNSKDWKIIKKLQRKYRI